jgi:hypothetical protein
MGLLPKPRLRNKLDSDRIESLSELPILKISAVDGDYYDNDNRGIHK